MTKQTEEGRPDQAIGCGRNLYYVGQHGPEDAADTAQRLALVVERDQLRAQVERLQGGEPVAEVRLMATGGNAGLATRIVEIDDPYRERLRPGTKLYTAQPAAPALVPLSKDQVKALAICLDSGRVSISEVQRKLRISFKAADDLCQSLVGGGYTGGLELAPSLRTNGIGQPVGGEG